MIPENLTPPFYKCQAKSFTILFKKYIYFTILLKPKKLLITIPKNQIFIFLFFYFFTNATRNPHGYKKPSTLPFWTAPTSQLADHIWLSSVETFPSLLDALYHQDVPPDPHAHTVQTAKDQAVTPIKHLYVLDPVRPGNLSKLTTPQPARIAVRVGSV